MTILGKKLQELKAKSRIGLMTHVVAGYPTIADTVNLVRVMAKEGVDIIELQIPFSDPLADGPTIMKACEKALANGVRVKDSFYVMQKLSQEVSIPLLFMAYYNTVFKYGTEKFCQDAKMAGASGLIVPDMPIEEESREHFMKYCNTYGLHHIHVVSPASTDKRLQENARVANGFIYVTARQGITGARKSLDSVIVTYLKKIRKYFSIPIAVGFGISQKEHLMALAPYADIAVVGSALIDVINKSGKSDLENNVKSFIRNLKMID